MDDEKLILLVQERSEIYNKFNPLFKLVEKKAEAWEDIGKEMGTTAEDCMRRWSCLRDRFSRECRKVDTSPGNNSTFVWPYLDMMEFLRPFVCPRYVRNSKFIRTSRKLSDVLQNRPVKLQIHSPPPSPTPSTSAPPETSPMECGEFAQINDDPLTETPLSQKEKFNSSPEVDKSFCEAVEALKRACALNEARHKNPAVHAFGEMIVTTICSMNSRNQLRAMQQVTDTVMRIKLEEDELVQQV